MVAEAQIIQKYTKIKLDVYPFKSVFEPDESVGLITKKLSAILINI